MTISVISFCAIFRSDFVLRHIYVTSPPAACLHAHLFTAAAKADRGFFKGCRHKYSLCGHRNGVQVKSPM